MRDLNAVLNQVLTVIPAEYISLRTQLMRIQDEIPYTAPEIIILRWREAQNILNEQIPTYGTAEWATIVQHIWNNTVE